MSLTTQVRISSIADLRDAGPLSNRRALSSLLGDLALTDGVDAGQADQVYTKSWALGATASATIDLSAFVNAVRQDVALLSVKFIAFKASTRNAGSVVVKPASAQPWLGPFTASTPALRVEPGGCVLLSNTAGGGWSVDPGTADRLTVENLSGADAWIDGLIIGIETEPVELSPTFDSDSFTFDSGDVTWDAA